MSFSFSIKTNFPDVQVQLESLHKEVAGAALASSLNKVTEQGKTQMAREIAAEFSIPVGEVRKRLVVDRASKRQARYAMSAALRGTGKRSANLIAFVERLVTMAQARTRMKKGEGGTYGLRNGAQMTKALQLRFKIRRTGPKKVIEGAFIANKGRTVFIREGKARLPIRALSTIDIPQMFNSKRINGEVRAVIAEKFPAIFAHEAKFFTDRFNAKGVRK